MTLFSIIITTYNHERFIKDAVDSALAQTCDEKEVIVVDDASSDSTVKVLEQYGDRIHLIKNLTNMGANLARNIGASAASGNFLVSLDGDDFFLPWALNVYKRIIELKNIRIILCRLLYFEGVVPKREFTYFGENVQIVEYDALVRKDRTYRGSVSAIVVEKQLFNEVGGWTAEMFPMEIDDLQIKLAYSGPAVHILSHPTVAYRMHPAQTMNQSHRFVDKMNVVISKEKHGEYPGGASGRYERYAYIGGIAFFWIKVAFREALYTRAVKLAARAWVMILAGIVSRLKIKIRGGRPVETITI